MSREAEQFTGRGVNPGRVAVNDWPRYALHKDSAEWELEFWLPRGRGAFFQLCTKAPSGFTVPWPFHEAEKLLALGMHLLEFRASTGLGVEGACPLASSSVSLTSTVSSYRARQCSLRSGIVCVHPSAGHLALGDC